MTHQIESMRLEHPSRLVKYANKQKKSNKNKIPLKFERL